MDAEGSVAPAARPIASNKPYRACSEMSDPKGPLGSFGRQQLPKRDEFFLCTSTMRCIGLRSITSRDLGMSRIGRLEIIKRLSMR